MKLNSLKNLSFDQWRWICNAYFRLWYVQLILKFGPSSWLISKCEFAGTSVNAENINSSDPQISKELDRAVEMFESVRLAARCHFWDTDCLPRSIVLADMLNRSAVVILGVTKAYRSQLTPLTPIGKQEDGSSLASHAWVELNGQMIGEPEEVAINFSRVKVGPD